VNGELRIRVSCVDGDSRVSENYAHAPFHYIPPCVVDGEAPLLTIVNSSGGVLGGDSLDVSLQMDREAALILRTQSATRIYRTSAGTARCACRFELGEGSFLDYFPDEIIPFAGSSFVQETHVDLAPGAAMLLSEIVTAGRLARDEQFEFACLALDVRCTGGGSLLLRDRSELRPGERMLDGAPILGDALVWGTLYVLTRDAIAAEWVARVAEAMESMEEGTGGATAGPIGMVVRAVGPSVDCVRGALRRARVAVLEQFGRSVR
jgi:urease accessory protein